MEVSDQLLCLFNAEVKERNGSYVVEIPEREPSIGELQEEEVYRVGVLTASSAAGTQAESKPEQREGRSGPPVGEGDRREVEITDLAEKGDGLVRIDGGFVVIVPDADIGDQVTVEITHVQENYAVDEVVEGQEARS